MAEFTLYGKRKICNTEVLDFTDFQGIGSDPLYKRFDSVYSVVEKYISPEHRDFLAHPIYSSNEDKIVWYVKEWTDAPVAYRDLTGQEKERYEAYRSSLIRGGPSVNHREMFIGGHNAVQREDAVESLLNSDIAMLTADEIQTISLYIRTNARKFQQTLRKNMAAHQRKRLDIKKTVEKSMRTDGDIARMTPQ